MTIKVLVVSTGYQKENGMSYPIRMTLAMKNIPGISVGLLCQNMEEDYEDLDIFLYEPIVDRVKVSKKEMDNLIKTVGNDWEVIIAGSDSVIEIAHHISVYLGHRPLTGFFMGFPYSRLRYPRWQQKYQGKLDFFARNVGRTLVPSYHTLENIGLMGHNGLATVVPLGVEDYSNIPPSENEIDEYELLVVTINRDAPHKELMDFFLMADRHRKHKFVWVCSRPSSQHLRTLQPPNLEIVQADDLAKIGLLKEADLFICTSKEEGYLLSCMEALACNTRVLVKSSPLAYELLWEHSKTRTVTFYESSMWINLEQIMQLKVTRWLPVTNIMQTAMIVLNLTFNDIKATHVNDVFNNKIPPSSQQVASLYDLMHHYDDVLIKMRGIDSPYHPDSWKYYFTAEHIKGTNILDMGCGSGHTLKKMLDDDYKVTGFDISKRVILQLEEQYGEYIKEGNLVVEQFDACNPHIFNTEGERIIEQFDSVICEELLEHVADPSLVVMSAIELTKKGGNAIFTTPIDHAADDPGHLQHFSKEDLSVLFAEFGKKFSIERMGNPEKSLNQEPSHFLIVLEV